MARERSASTKAAVGAGVGGATRAKEGGARRRQTRVVTLVEARVATTAKSQPERASSRANMNLSGANEREHAAQIQQPPSYEVHLRRALEHAAEDKGVDAEFIQRAIRQSVSRMAREHRDAATTLYMIQRYYDDRMEDIQRHENDADALQDERDALKSAYELVVCERDDAYSIRERARNAECDAQRRLEALRIERDERVGDYNRLAHVIRQVYDGVLRPNQLEDIVRGMDDDSKRRRRAVTFDAGALSSGAATSRKVTEDEGTQSEANDGKYDDDDSSSVDRRNDDDDDDDDETRRD